MTTLVWDAVGEKTFENGISKGVLYLPNGLGVPWNGLTSVTEKTGRSFTPIYFDGQKVGNNVVLGEYEATLNAITYPQEFREMEGDYEIRTGALLTHQPPKVFGLSYRTELGDDVAGQSSGYLLHVVYYLVAVPADRTYSSLGADPSAMEFSWELSSVPPDATGFRPTAHVILDSRTLASGLLSDIEDILYGTEDDYPQLPEFDSFMETITSYFMLLITDHGDGTWTAEENPDYDGYFISFDDIDPTLFTIEHANAIYTAVDTYQITTTDNVDDETPEP